MRKWLLTRLAVGALLAIPAAGCCPTCPVRRAVVDCAPGPRGIAVSAFCEPERDAVLLKGLGPALAGAPVNIPAGAQATQAVPGPGGGVELR